MSSYATAYQSALESIRLYEKTDGAWSALERGWASEIRALSSIVRELEPNWATSAGGMLRDFQSAGLAASRMVAGLDTGRSVAETIDSMRAAAAAEPARISSVKRQLQPNVETGVTGALPDLECLRLAATSAARMIHELQIDHVNSIRRMVAALITPLQELDGSLFTKSMGAATAIRAASTPTSTREFQRIIEKGALDILLDLNSARLVHRGVQMIHPAGALGRSGAGDNTAYVPMRG